MENLYDYCENILIDISEYELKSFINNGHATVVYENDQMNTVVYKQLNELYQYLEDLESKVNEIKSNIK